MRPRPGMHDARDRAAIRGGGLEFARNVAADLRLLSFLSRGRRGGRILVERAAFDIDELVREVVREGNVAGPGVELWEAHGTLPTVSETVVIFVGPRGAPPEAVIKVANEAPGRRALEREHAVLGSLHEDERLEPLHPLIPAVRGRGEAHGRPYLVESLMPGVEARRLLKDGPRRPEVLTAAASTIGDVHRLTATDPIPVDERVRRQWVDGPVAVLEAATSGLGHHRARELALGRLADEAHDALRGKELPRGWVHGDYVPANVFVAPDGTRVTGIVDWELADPDGLPQLDSVHFLLTTRVLTRRRELGQIVRELLIEPQLDEGEQRMLELADRNIPGDKLDVRALVLLCWLQHANATLVKSERYADSRLWLTLNVESVLRAFA